MTPVKYTIGILSGTSADGIDTAVVANARSKPSIIAAHCYRYKPATAKLICGAADTALTAREIALLHVAVGREFAYAIRNLLARSKIPARDIAVVGSHGQTVLHISGVSSLQLGAPAVIAAETGLTVAADFRLDDIAVGGAGAPLVPVLDQMLLGKISREQRAGALNLGGIANVTVVTDGEVEQAYDIGPANSLIDAAMRRFFQANYDKSGATAQSGTCHAPLLDYSLAHSYFRKRAPKTTGPEEFGGQYLRELHERFPNVLPIDFVATLTELTARSCANALQILRIDTVYVSGGGLRNRFLMRRIAELSTPTRIKSSDALGIDPDFKEAALFASLGALRLARTPIDLRRVTGARRPKILGGLWLP